MDKAEAEELVEVLVQNEVGKLLVKERQKAALEEQFGRKQLALKELSGKIHLVILGFIHYNYLSNCLKKKNYGNNISNYRIKMTEILQQVYQQKLTLERRRRRRKNILLQKFKMIWTWDWFTGS